MRRVAIICGWLLISTAAQAAPIPIDRATIRWDPAAGQRYEVRVQHFAHPEWIALGTVEAATGALVYVFSPSLPIGQPGDDRWACAEARNVTQPNTPSAWVRACNQVALGVAPAPELPPPPPPPPPPPAPTPTLDERLSSVELQLAVIEAAVRTLEATPDRTNDIALRHAIVQAATSCLTKCSLSGFAKELKRLIEGLP